MLLAGWSRVRFRTNFWHKSVTGVFPGGKGGRCVGLTTLPPSCADFLAILELQPSGPTGPLQTYTEVALGDNKTSRNEVLWTPCQRCAVNWRRQKNREVSGPASEQLLLAAHLYRIFSVHWQRTANTLKGSLTKGQPQARHGEISTYRTQQTLVSLHSLHRGCWTSVQNVQQLFSKQCAALLAN